MDDSLVLLDRTNLNISFEDFNKKIEILFPSIGEISDILPIMEGYEDANFIIKSSTGEFVLKIFLKERSIENIENYVRVLRDCKSINVPTIEILLDFNNGLGFIESNGIKTYFIITKYFNGDSFLNITPTVSDIRNITRFVSSINTLNFPVSETYDSWGNKNFDREYLLNKNKITSEQNGLIEGIYDEFINLDLSCFSKSVIHGDMQRKHVKKNRLGEYCILDFGCMANDYKVIDLSTYLAWFCFQEDTWIEKEKIYNEVIYIYDKIHYLTDMEIQSLPILIKASYAAYYLKTSVLINNGSKSKETFDWYNSAKKMLELTKGWKN